MWHLPRFSSLDEQNNFVNYEIPDNVILELWEEIDNKHILLGLIRSNNLGHNVSYFKTLITDKCMYRMCPYNKIYYICIQSIQEYKNEKIIEKNKERYFYDRTKIFEEYNKQIKKNKKILSIYTITYEIMEYTKESLYEVSKTEYKSF